MSRRRQSSSLPPSLDPPDKGKAASRKQLEHQFRYALELFEDGLFEEALEETRQLLAKEDKHFEFWCIEGKIRAALGEDQAAERSFNRACQLAPGLPEPLLHKASFFNHLGRFDEAVQLCEQALRHTDQADDRQNAYFMLAESWIGIARQGMTAFLEQIGQEMEDEEDGDPSEIQVPAELQEIYQRGLEMIQKALDIDESDAELWHLQAGAFMDLQRIEEAIESFQRAVEFDGENPEYWHDLGVAYEIAEQHDLSRQAYQRLYALETGPDAEGMEFSRQEFASVVRDVWSFLESEVSEVLAHNLQIDVTTQDFPSAELLQNTDDEPFDPWLPLRLEIHTDENNENAIRCILYQRNVERESGASTPQELADYLRYLLEEVLLRTPDLDDEAIEA